jgi:hypothetical protein
MREYSKEAPPLTLSELALVEADLHSHILLVHRNAPFEKLSGDQHGPLPVVVLLPLDALHVELGRPVGRRGRAVRAAARRAPPLASTG